MKSVNHIKILCDFACVPPHLKRYKSICSTYKIRTTTLGEGKLQIQTNFTPLRFLNFGFSFCEWQEGWVIRNVYIPMFTHVYFISPYVFIPPYFHTYILYPHTFLYPYSDRYILYLHTFLYPHIYTHIFLHPHIHTHTLMAKAHLPGRCLFGFSPQLKIFLLLFIPLSSFSWLDGFYDFVGYYVHFKTIYIPGFLDLFIFDLFHGYIFCLAVFSLRMC